AELPLGSAYPETVCRYIDLRPRNGVYYRLDLIRYVLGLPAPGRLQETRNDVNQYRGIVLPCPFRPAFYFVLRGKQYVRVLRILRYCIGIIHRNWLAVYGYIAINGLKVPDPYSRRYIHFTMLAMPF